VPDDYQGKITLDIRGVPSGADLRVEKFCDLDGNGRVDSTDWLLQGFVVTDGHLPVIGGVRNLNVAGDEDGIQNGQVRAEMLMPGVAPISGRAVGRFVYRVSGIAGGFEPVTGTFRVTQTVMAQGVTGRVRDAGTGAALRASVALVQQNGSQGTFVMTDEAGFFTLYGEPVMYILVPSLSGYVCDLATALIQLDSGQMMARDLSLTAGTLKVSGQVLDADRHLGVAGVMISAESDTGLFSFGFTDSEGLMDSRLLPGNWELRLDRDSLAMQGYVGFDEPFEANLTADLTGFTVPLARANALIYGTIKDEASQPVLGITVRAEEPDEEFEPTGTALTAAGDYCLGVLGGTTWTVNFEDDELQEAGYFGPRVQVPIVTGQAVRQDLVLRRRTSVIAGHVRSPAGQPIPNLYLWAGTSIGGVFYHADRTTGIDGSFRVGVSPGTWTVGVDGGGDEGLFARGYGCPGEQAVVVTGAQNTLEILTATPLPAGTAGLRYNVALAASGGTAPYAWSRKPGSASLPDGLSLSADGVLGGVPAAAGTFYFILRVTDSSAQTKSVDKTFALTIHGAGPGFPVAVGSANELTWGIATDGTNFLVTYADTAQAFSVTARLVSPTGELLEPLFRPDRVGGASQAAFGGGVYLMVWEDRTGQASTDLYGQRLHPDGTGWGNPFPICTAAGDQRLDSRKGLIFDGTNFLILWRDHRAGAANADIYGQRIAPDGTMVGTEMVVAGQAGTQGNLGAAFDGTRTLVVWMNQLAAGQESYDVWGAFVSKTGVVSDPFRISQTTSPRAYSARVAWNGARYLAVWLLDRATSISNPAAWDLAGRVLGSDGSLAGDEFIQPGVGQQVAAAVLPLGSGFLAHWLDDFGGAHPAQMGQMFDPEGRPAGVPFRIASAFGTRVPLGAVIPTEPGLLSIFMYANWVYQDDLRGPLTEADIYGQFIARPSWLAAPERLADGTVRIRFEGGRNVNHTLEATADQTSWQTLLTTDNPSGTVTHLDTTAPGLTARFYRVSLAP